MSQTKAQLISDLVQALNFTGTASAPANGAFLSATNTLALATNSAQRLTINSSGNIGIGTTSPSANLDIQGSGSPALKVTDTTNTTTAQVSANDTKALYGSLTNHAVQIDQNGGAALLIDTSKRVGIGTTSPDTELHVKGVGTILKLETTATTGSNYISFDDADEEKAFLGLGSGSDDSLSIWLRKSSNIRFATNNTEKVRIDSSGKVGIGTTSPDQVLHVIGTGGDTVPVRVESTGITSRIGFQASGTANSYNVACGAAAEDFTFHTGNTERMRLDSSGRLGIGHDTPGSFSSGAHTLVLNTSSGNCGLTISTSAADQTGSIFFAEGASSTGDGRIRYEHANNAMAFSTADTERMRIQSDGKIGIGRTDPVNFVDIHRGADEENILIVRGQDTSGEYCALGVNGSDAIVTAGGVSGNNTNLVFRTAPNGNETERMRISSDGKVGINIAGSDNTSPVRNLDIADSSGAILRLISSDDSLGVNERLGEIEFFTDDDDGGHIGSFIKAIADPSDSFGRRTALLFGTQSAEAQNAIERVRIPAAGGITFNGDTAAANALDDYEEGSFTPTVATGVSAIGYTTQEGRYTKIGDRVDFTLIIRIGSATLTSSAIKFGGLPFTSANTTERAGGAFIPQSSGNFGTTNTFRVNHNSTEIQVISAAGDAVAGTSTSFNTTNRMIALVGFYFV